MNLQRMEKTTTSRPVRKARAENNIDLREKFHSQYETHRAAKQRCRIYALFLRKRLFFIPLLTDLKGVTKMKKTYLSLVIFLLVIIFALMLSSCESKTLPPIVDPEFEEDLVLTVATSSPGIVAIEEDCFLGYDLEGNLWRIYWNGVDEIQEGKIYLLHVKELTENQKPAELTPKYISTALSVEEKQRIDPSTLPQITSASKYNDFFHNAQLTSIYMDGIDYYNPQLERSRSVVLANDATANLIYQSSRRSTWFDYARYISSDGNVTCDFDTVTGEPVQIITQNGVLPLPDAMTSEEGYQAWIASWLSKLGMSDFSEYQYLGCETMVQVSKPNCVYNDKYSYLYTDLKEYESISSRTLKYARYVDGYQTSDYVSITFRYTLGGGMLIKLGTQSFGNVESLPFDYDSLPEIAESYVRNALKTDSFEILGLETKGMTLRCYGGRIFVDLKVDFLLEWPMYEDEEFDYRVTVLIFLD